MRRPPRTQKGFALILVIWALVLLVSLGSGFSYALRHEVRAASDLETHTARFWFPSPQGGYRLGLLLRSTGCIPAPEGQGWGA